MNGLIDQIENHEAVAQSVLDDIRESIAKVRFQVKRIEHETRGLEKKLGETLEEEAKWKDRALKLEATDRARAIDCVQRLKQTRIKIDETRRQIQEHQTLGRQLTDQLRQIEAKYEEFRRKQSLLAGRESRGEALQQMAGIEPGACANNVFDRWERKVMRNEAHSECLLDAPDSLAQEFQEQEDRADLELMLEEMKKKEKGE